MFSLLATPLSELESSPSRKPVETTRANTSAPPDRANFLSASGNDANRLLPGVPLPAGAQFFPNGQGDPSRSSPTAGFPGFAEMPLRPSGLDAPPGANSLGSPMFANQQSAPLSVQQPAASESMPLAPAAAGSWSIVTSPNTSTTQNNLLGVTCVSASNCWTVGFYVASSGAPQTLIEHWDGTAWAIVPSPNASLPNNVLSDVTCLSASDCWAVGYYITAPSVYQTLIERWDGTSWAIVTSPNAAQINRLNAVTCRSASDCWAVGYSEIVGTGTLNIDQTLIEHWNGTSWAIVTSPNTSTTQYNYLFGVTCVSASECWAVGLSGTSLGQTLIERWGGTSWAIVTSPNTSATLSNFLYGVTCVSATDCWAVGYYYNGSVSLTLTEHYAVPPVQLNAVVSRKTHGSAGTFDVGLPQTGQPGIECRDGGTNGDYTIIFTFANTLASVGGASVTSGTGTVSSRNIDSNDFRNYVVNLTGVTNAQVIKVSLTNVTDSAGDFSSAVSTSMGVLVGDVNASGVVTSGDTNLCKAQALQPVTNANFRNDVNASGSITTGDVNIIKQNALSHL